MKLCVWTAALAVLSMAGHAVSNAETPATSQAAAVSVREFPHAGIALSVPAGFADRAPSSPSDVMQAVLTEGDRPVKSISLAAIPIGPQDNADTVGEKIVADLRKNLSFRHISELRRLPWPIAGQSGAARLLTYSFQGNDYVAIQICFIRDIESPKLRMAHLLNAEVAVSYRPQLFDIVRQVSDSIRLMPLKPASLLPVGPPGDPLPDNRLGYSFRPPVGWFVRPVQDGMVMGLADYVLGRPSPVLQIIVQQAPMLTTANECVQKLAMYEKGFAEKNGLTVELGEQSQAAMVGQEAQQLALFEADPNSAPGQAPEAVTVTFRALCVPGQAGEAAHIYALRLTTPGKDAQAAAGMMDKLAAGFAMLQPSSEPAATAPGQTQPAGAGPATAPAAPGPAAPSTQDRPTPSMPAGLLPASAPANTTPSGADAPNALTAPPPAK